MGSHSSRGTNQNGAHVSGTPVDFINSTQSGLSCNILQEDQGTRYTNIVLTTFTWTLGGNSVYVTGTFTKWKNHIMLQKDGHLFSTTIQLQRGLHQYKFIVDGEWRFNPEDPTTPDDQGNINNFIDTTQGNGRMESQRESTEVTRTVQDHKSKLFLSVQQFNEQAPKLPPHLNQCKYLDNKQQINLKQRSKSLNQMEIQSLKFSKPTLIEVFDSPHSLPPPTHVNLNHLAIKASSNYNIFAITHRFKSKYTTYKFYTHKNKSHFEA